MSDYDRMQRANVELQRRVEELEALLAEYRRAGDARKLPADVPVDFDWDNRTGT